MGAQQRTQGLDGVVQGDVTELLVHVVGATAAVVTQGDAVVVHDAAVALADLQCPTLERRSEHWATCDTVHGQQHMALFAHDTRAMHKAHTRTSFTARISPVDFFIFEYWCRKYQKRDLATTSFLANTRMRKICGWGLVSVGWRRPTIWYWRS